MTYSSNKFQRQREHYPALNKWVYLDHASGGLYADYASKAMIQYIEGMTGNSMTFREFTETWEFADESRCEVARMFNSKPSEIMYGLSSTWLFNIFINGIDLKPGDNIITTTTSHASVPYVMLNKRQDGVEVRMHAPVDGNTHPEDIFSLVDENTKAICLCHVENTYGFRHNLKVYGEFCRQHGIYFGVDATQAAGVMKIDVNEMKIDFLTTSCYKWLGCLLGLGFAYISSDLQKNLKLVDAGWSSSKDRWNKKTEYPDLSEDARRFECGGISVVALKGVIPIIRNYNEMGANDIERYCLLMVDDLYSKVNLRLGKVKIFGDFPKENRSAMVTLSVPVEWNLSDAVMAESGIRAHCMAPGLIRVGFHFYNNFDDVEALVKYFENLEQNSSGD